MIDELLQQQTDQTAAADRQRQQALRDANDIKTLLGMAEGRRVFARILAHCGVDQATFSPGQPDVAAFRDGRRDVGIWLTTHLMAHPALYLNFLREALYGRNDNDNDDRNGNG